MGSILWPSADLQRENFINIYANNSFDLICDWKPIIYFMSTDRYNWNWQMDWFHQWFIDKSCQFDHRIDSLINS